MSWRVFLRPGENPVERFEDPFLGSMNWDADEESWKGESHGQVFLIGYERSSPEPLGRLLEYARSVISDSSWRTAALASAKADYLAKYPNYKSELSPLAPEEIAFLPHRKGDLMNWVLGYGDPDRLWFVEFHGRELTHIGFHS